MAACAASSSLKPVRKTRVGAMTIAYGAPSEMPRRPSYLEMWIDIETGTIYRERDGKWLLYGYLNFSVCWPRPDFYDPNIPEIEVECGDGDTCEFTWPSGDGI